jgi:hypothetical protein
MAIVVIIVIAALGAALFFIRVSRGHAEAISNLEELSGRTQSVDLAAFRNLIDPAETAFLRAHLNSASFRSVQRERNQAAAEYVERIAQNAAILLRLGQAARTNPDPEIAKAAQSMIERALVVRMIAMQALVKLKLQALLPGIDFSNLDVFERYGRLTESAALFTRLQRPAYSAHVLAML